MFDIDPLADRPPNDVRVSQLALGAVPSAIKVPLQHPDVGALLRARMLELLARIEDHQWSNGTAGLLDEINGARALQAHERADRIERALEPHLGRVLFLARHVAGQARSSAQTDVEKYTAEQLEALTAGDPTSRDGLTDLSRAALRSAARALADAVATELAQHPLDDARLRLLLAGGPGAAIIGVALGGHIVAAVARQ
jgi:hypothetical protein